MNFMTIRLELRVTPSLILLVRDVKEYWFGYPCYVQNFSFIFVQSSIAVFSALVHDLDHLGVPNTVLVSENSPLAKKYKGKSVAQGGRGDIAYKILLNPDFKDLQECIFANDDEYSRFRSLVVNLVLATDIMDKELGAQRKQRWAHS